MARRLLVPEVVSDVPLDPQELEALQAAIRQPPSPAAAAAAAAAEAVPWPLFAADRSARAARPRLAELAQRWSRWLTRTLRAFVGDAVVESLGAEIVDTTTLADELRPMWVGLVEPGTRGALIVAFGGDVIEAAAARRCGASVIKAAGREPTPLARRLFEPAGQAALAAFERAWSELEPIALTRHAPHPEALALALGGDTIVAATLAISGGATGRVRILARPDVILSPADVTPTVPADAATIAAALGAVPVELRVELATVPIKLEELRALGPGSELTLPVFIDDAMPIYCGDVLKAWGRPVVTRGVVAVEVAAVAVPGGTRP